jgi:hypothetical protein
MKLNNQLVELARINLDRSDRVRIRDIAGFEKMSSVYLALRGKRNVSKFQYDLIQKYITSKSLTIY